MKSIHSYVNANANVMKTRWHNSFKIYIGHQDKKQKPARTIWHSKDSETLEETPAIGHSCMLLGAFVVNFHAHDLRLCPEKESDPFLSLWAHYLCTARTHK